MTTVVFETERLIIRLPALADAELFYTLWTDPEVMTNVGFPQGLRITREEIADNIRKQGHGVVLDRYLVVELRETGRSIGECKLGRPNEDGIAITDIKLLPAFWGHKYGVEVKRGLLDYLFRHTDCEAVEATPNVNNIASIKMQEAVGGIRIGEGVFTFPEHMHSYTTPVHHYIYRVFRVDWEAAMTK